ncbi:AraC family transcriptional regulator [Rahnella ecdela]|uniref:AraC family transcriptional regulator n=1 Tax=Rahnella ecdela TaxID=2816250 RepID=A0ABS6LL15_9GAMM|nr:AraC family transcriptional regulator [Rahnella ecdela]MBU9847236.1 AraC family transcriptional regulator [Rahnella ecdela]
MDPLSDVLSLLKPRSYMSKGFEAGGEWSVQFPDHYQSIKCNAIITGECWLAVDGVPAAVHLQAGDCFVLPSGRPFRLASDLSIPPVDAVPIFEQARDGGTVSCNGGKDFFLTGSRFAVNGTNASTLLAMLPPVVHISKESDRQSLRWAVECMMQELRDERPGGLLIAQHMAHMMLVQALRMHVDNTQEGENSGWFAALADKQLSQALNAMHENPSHRWTVQTLAERAGMSRSVFSQKFKLAVGSAPLEYLTRWRMLLAGDRLTNSKEPVSAVALSLGYESESAFSTAFKRTLGCSPRQYGQKGEAGEENAALAE